MRVYIWYPDGQLLGFDSNMCYGPSTATGFDSSQQGPSVPPRFRAGDLARPRAFPDHSSLHASELGTRSDHVLLPDHASLHASELGTRSDHVLLLDHASLHASELGTRQTTCPDHACLSQQQTSRWLRPPVATFLSMLRFQDSTRQFSLIIAPIDGSGLLEPRVLTVQVSVSVFWQLVTQDFFLKA